MDQVAVIVPIYKVEGYLDACVASIREQTYRELAIVLVDDGSPDRCGEMCDAYAREDARITVLHRPNGGLSAARNTGLDWVERHPEVSWVTFVDSDDTLHPDFVKALVNGVASCGAEISCVAFEKVSEPKRGGGPYEPLFRAMTPEAFWCADQLRATVSTCKLYARGLFASVRFPEGLLHEDELTTYRVLFKVPRIAVGEARLYYYLQRANSIMGRRGRMWSVRDRACARGYRDQVIYFRRHGFASAARESVRVMTYCYAAAYRALRAQKVDRAYLPVLRKWTVGTLRLARERYGCQIAEVWMAYFVLWPLVFNRVTWPFVRVYDLLSSMGPKGLVATLRKRFG